MSKALDLVGQRIGKLVVLKRVPDTSGRKQSWFLCGCLCGNRKKVLGYYLNSKKTISCGCAQKEAARRTRMIKIDRRRKFGRLRITSEPVKKGIKTFYPCMCSCGNNTLVESYALRNGLTKSCGCLHRESITKHGKSQTNAYKRVKAAERRAILYSLNNHYDVEDVERKFIEQGESCYYCGRDLNLSGFHEEHRVPLSRGGTNDSHNLCLSCPSCNLRKGTKTEEEFLSAQE